jgi:hypothetical protein
MIKLMFCLRRRPELSRTEFLDYWKRKHAPLVAKHRRVLKIERYVQFHGHDPKLLAETGAARGGLTPYDGIAMLWWRDADAVTEIMSDPEALRAGAELLEDEKKFIDLTRSPVTWGEEDVIFTT